MLFGIRDEGDDAGELRLFVLFEDAGADIKLLLFRLL